ncbi:thioesterase domain-containing protein [Scytonema sp. PCC 10023]|uniref:thioesterase domain-containing protein n=1 Tax=Scytonema sp. PCC 10023 TaxID=1680591 RepID=UPI0039C708F2
MKTVDQLLSNLEKLEIQLWLDEEVRLRYSAPKGALSSQLRDELRERKAEIIDYLHHKHRVAKMPPIESILVKIQPGGTKPPLFCVHPAGGNVFCYLELSRHLGLDQPLYGLRPPNLYSQEESLNSIEDMAAAYIKVMQSVQPQGPYYLAASSFGGVVIYEMAQQLQASGQEVSFLGMLDMPLPTSTDMKNQIEKMGNEYYLVLTAFADSTVGALGEYSQQIIIDELRTFSELDVQLNYILQKLIKLKLLPAEFTFEQFRHLFDVFEGNVTAGMRYTMKTYPGKVVFFRATEDIIDLFHEYQDPTRGWSEFALGGVDVHEIEGNHYSMLRSPVLAEKIKPYLMGERVARQENIKTFVNSYHT